MSLPASLRTAPLDRTAALDVAAVSLDRDLTRGRIGLLSLGGLVACGSLVVVAAATTDALLPQSIQPAPGDLAGIFGGSGLGLGTAPLLFTLAAMFGCYVAAVNLSDRLSGRAVLIAVLVLHVLVVLGPPLFSTDVFSYQAYGRMWASYGTNPYLHGPGTIALDPVYPYIGADWVSSPTAYGPVFTVLSSVFAPLSLAASVLAYKLVAAAASLACVALIWHAASRRGLDRVRGAALYGLNPLVLLYGVGGGHNDLLMLAAVCAGLQALSVGRVRNAGAMLILGAGLKLTGALLLPFALAARAGGAEGSRRRQLLLGGGLAAAAIAAASFVAFGTGLLHLPVTLAQNQGAGDWHSIPGFVSARLGLGSAGHIIGVGLGLACLGTIVWLLRRVYHGRFDWIEAAAWATFALLISASALQPWYVTWLLPLVALSRDQRLWRAARWITGVVIGLQLLGYIPHVGP